MSIVIYLAVILIGAAAAMFGLDLMTSPLPKMPPNVPIGRTAPQQHAARAPESQAAHPETGHADGTLSPIDPAHPGADKNVRMVYPPTTGPGSDFVPKTQSADTLTDKAETAQAARKPAETTGNAQTEARQADADAAQPFAQQTQGPRCDVQACRAAYISFHASDCTYQPVHGPRRLCTRSGDETTSAKAETQQPKDAAKESARSEREQAARKPAETVAPRQHNARRVVAPKRAAPREERRETVGYATNKKPVRRSASRPAGRYDELRDTGRVANQAPDRRVAPRRDDAETSEAARIIKRMMRGQGNIPVQRADGSVIIVDTGSPLSAYR